MEIDERSHDHRAETHIEQDRLHRALRFPGESFTLFRGAMNRAEGAEDAAISRLCAYWPPARGALILQLSCVVRHGQRQRRPALGARQGALVLDAGHTFSIHREQAGSSRTRDPSARRWTDMPGARSDSRGSRSSGVIQPSTRSGSTLMHLPGLAVRSLRGAELLHRARARCSMRPARWL